LLPAAYAVFEEPCGASGDGESGDGFAVGCEWSVTGFSDRSLLGWVLVTCIVRLLG